MFFLRIRFWPTTGLHLSTWHKWNLIWCNKRWEEEKGKQEKHGLEKTKRQIKIKKTKRQIKRKKTKRQIKRKKTKTSSAQRGNGRSMGWHGTSRYNIGLLRPVTNLATSFKFEYMEIPPKHICHIYLSNRRLLWNLPSHQSHTWTNSDWPKKNEMSLWPIASWSSN